MNDKWPKLKNECPRCGDIIPTRKMYLFYPYYCPKCEIHFFNGTDISAIGEKIKK